MEENILLKNIEKEFFDLIKRLEKKNMTEVEVFSVLRESAHFNDFYLNYFLELFFVELIKSDSQLKPKSLIKKLFENVEPEFQVYPDIISGFQTRFKVLEKYKLEKTGKIYNKFLSELENFSGDRVQEFKFICDYRSKILDNLESEL